MLANNVIKCCINIALNGFQLAIILPLFCMGLKLGLLPSFETTLRVSDSKALRIIFGTQSWQDVKSSVLEWVLKEVMWSVYIINKYWPLLSSV